MTGRRNRFLEAPPTVCPTRHVHQSAGRCLYHRRVDYVAIRLKITAIGRQHFCGAIPAAAGAKIVEHKGMVGIARIAAQVSRDRLAPSGLQHPHRRFVRVDRRTLEHLLANQPFQRPQRQGRPPQQPAQQRPRQPALHRTQEQFLLPIQRQMVQELPGHQPAQNTRPEGALLHSLRRLLRGHHLRAIAAVRTAVGVPHLFDHVDFCFFHLQSLGYVGAGDDPLSAAVAAG